MCIKRALSLGSAGKRTTFLEVEELESQSAVAFLNMSDHRREDFRVGTGLPYHAP